MQFEDSVEFEQSIERIEKCTQELARLQGRTAVAFFKSPLGIKLLKWFWFFIFSFLLIAPLVGVLGTDVKLHRWFVIYFSVVSLFLGALAAAIAARPLELDILNALLTLKGKVKYVISEDGLQCQHNGTTSHTPWSSFSNVALSENFMVLAHSDNQFSYIPLEAFQSKAGVDKFAVAVSQKISANTVNKTHQ